MSRRLMVKYTLAVLAMFFACGCYMAHSLFAHQFSVGKESCLYIDADDDLDSVIFKLKSETGVSSMVGFNIGASLVKLSDRDMTGRYLIQDMSAFQVVRMLRNHAQTPFRLVLPSVRTVQDLCGFLGRELMADSASFMQLMSDDAACAELGYSAATIPALFVPNTYEVYWNISAESFLKRMQREHDSFWTEERKTKAKHLSMTLEQVVTLASIVDEETANNAEKPRIAGLYLNRLRIGMPLQSDPTVKFALKDFGLKRILNAHLAVESPYNTYKVNGLPPGPIRIPTIAGIDAVLNHEAHTYIYMCAKEDFSGTHNFATDYNEHLRNAHRYAKALNAHGY